MEWQDEGVILSVSKHGESAAILDMLTQKHGRHAGVLRGGASRKWAGMLQPGNDLKLTWRARLEGHIGTYQVDLMRSRAGIMADRKRLYALNAMTAMARFSLPERFALPEFYALSLDLLSEIESTDDWGAAYALWELRLLDEIGYGLDLSSCAATGVEGDLAYVSPKTGRAVSKQGAGEWVDRLLVLPDFLLDQRLSKNPDAIKAALKLTGHFFEQRLLPMKGRGVTGLPEQRARLVALIG